MKIRLNGSITETRATTISQLIDELGLPRQTVLVEQNGAPPARNKWETAPIQDGDVIELLRISAGG